MTIERRPGAEPAPEELATTTPHRPSLWRQGDFMKLWTGQTISQFGDEITGLGVPLLATLILGAGALEMGILGVVRFLPWILFTLPAGVWVDRMRRRPILIGADLARAVLLASIPLAFVGGWLSLIQVYVVAFLAGTLEVFFDVAYQSYLPSIVERDELVEGNSKLELSRAASSVAGPTIAGFLHPAHQAPFAIVFDALSYLAAALFVGLIRRPEAGPVPHDPATGERPSMWQEARAGVGYVVSNRYLRSIAASTGTSNLFGNISGAVLILYLVKEDIGLGPHRRRDRHNLRARQYRGPVRRAERRTDGEADRRSDRRSCLGRGLRALRRSPCHSPRRTTRSGCSSSAASSPASARSSTTSTRWGCARRSLPTVCWVE